MKFLFYFLFLFVVYISNAQLQPYVIKLKYDLDTKPDSVAKYFDEVCVNNRTPNEWRYSRWENDVYIFLCVEDSSIKDDVISKTKKIIYELNNLIDPISIYLTDDPKKMNCFGVFGSFDYFNEMSLKYERRLKLYDDGTTGGVNSSINSLEKIYKSYFFVNYKDTKFYGEKFTEHVLVEELVQSMGFQHDSWLYENSIFYDGFNPYTCPTELSDLDKEIIKILYNENKK